MIYMLYDLVFTFLKGRVVIKVKNIVMLQLFFYLLCFQIYLQDLSVTKNINFTGETWCHLVIHNKSKGLTRCSFLQCFFDFRTTMRLLWSTVLFLYGSLWKQTGKALLRSRASGLYGVSYTGKVGKICCGSAVATKLFFSGIFFKFYGKNQKPKNYLNLRDNYK